MRILVRASDVKEGCLSFIGRCILKLLAHLEFIGYETGFTILSNGICTNILLS